MLYSNPPPRESYDTRANSKQVKVGLISEFSFSWTDCQRNTKEAILPRSRDEFSVKRNAYYLIQDLNSGHQFYFLRRYGESVTHRSSMV